MGTTLQKKLKEEGTKSPRYRQKQKSLPKITIKQLQRTKNKEPKNQQSNSTFPAQCQYQKIQPTHHTKTQFYPSCRSTYTYTYMYMYMYIVYTVQYIYLRIHRMYVCTYVCACTTVQHVHVHTHNIHTCTEMYRQMYTYIL